MTQKRAKRILMLVENCPYPQDIRVRSEATTLTSAGYQVTVVAQKASGQKNHEIVDDVRVYRYPAPPELPSIVGFAFEYIYSYLTALIYSVWILLRHGFDVIHAHNPPDIYVFLAIPYKLAGKKFVFDHHDLTPEVFKAIFSGKGTKWIYKLLMMMEYLSLKSAHHVIATNESYKARHTDLHAIASSKITVVRNGPDLTRFQPLAADPGLRSKAGTILGYAGTMGKQDGIDYLIRSLHCLVYELQITDIYCVIIGSGSQEKHLKELVQELNLDKYVWFPGWLDTETLVRYLSTTDICLGPDPKNSFNDHSTMIKIMEYMALAKPIVSFDLNETIYSAADSAVYVTDNNELEFARAISDLIKNPDKQARMGQAGYTRIKNKLAWNYSAEKLLEVYTSLFKEEN